MEKFKGKTATGFEFEINKAAFDDMEIIEALAEADNGDPLAWLPIVNKLFDSDEKKRLYTHVRADDGRVPIEKVGAEIASILNALGEAGKNA